MKFKNIYLIPISIVFIIVAVYLYSKSDTVLEDSFKNMIEFTSCTEENQKSYFYPDFVAFDDENYYIVYKDSQIYVLKSNINLNKKSLDGSFVRVVGTTKIANDEVKKTVTNIYNNYYKDEENSKINDEAGKPYENLFGNYYLEVDSVINDLTIASKTRDFANFSLEIAIVMITMFIIKTIVDYKRQIF